MVQVSVYFDEDTQLNVHRVPEKEFNELAKKLRIVPRKLSGYHHFTLKLSDELEIVFFT